MVVKEVLLELNNYSIILAFHYRHEPMNVVYEHLFNKYFAFDLVH